MDLYDILSQMDPQALQSMMDAGLAPQRAGIAKQQFGVGSGMMGTPMPEGRQVGQTYVASSPLEHLAAAVQRAVGSKMAKGAMAREEDLAKQTGAGRTELLRTIARVRGQQQQPGQSAVPDLIDPSQA